MASLLVGVGVLMHDRIQAAKAKKKEKKRKAYEDRYNELEKEHKSHTEQYLGRQETGDSSTSPSIAQTTNLNTQPRPSSSDSQRSISGGETADDPARWVADAMKERQRTG